MTRKKGDQDIGSSNLVPTGLRVWRNHPFAESSEGVDQDSGRSESSPTEGCLAELPQLGSPDNQRWSWCACMNCGWACWSCFFATRSQDVSV